MALPCESSKIAVVNIVSCAQVYPRIEQHFDFRNGVLDLLSLRERLSYLREINSIFLFHSDLLIFSVVAITQVVQMQVHDFARIERYVGHVGFASGHALELASRGTFGK